MNIPKNSTLHTILRALLFIPGENRFLEIDAVRGIAIVMMVIFHTAFDLAYFGVAPLNVTTGGWKILAVATASLFLLVSGLSTNLSLNRRSQSTGQMGNTKKTVIHGGKILIYGLCITLATSFYPGDGYIVFGILHLIGCCIIVSPLLIRAGKSAITAGVFIIFLGLITAKLTGHPWLIPLGIPPAAFWSLDYTPFVPWAGVFLIGLGIAFFLYPAGERRFSISDTKVVKILAVPGRFSLPIYLFHQPVIITIIWLLFGIPLL